MLSTAMRVTPLVGLPVGGVRPVRARQTRCAGASRQASASKGLGQALRRDCRASPLALRCRGLPQLSPRRLVVAAAARDPKDGGNTKSESSKDGKKADSSPQTDSNKPVLASETKKNETPGGSGDDKKDEDKKNFFQWFSEVFQPVRVLQLAIQISFFFFGVSFIQSNIDKQPHVIGTSYARFLRAVRDDDVAKLEVDGTYLTWWPRKQIFLSKSSPPAPTDISKDNVVSVAYSCVRPGDISTPYETLVKNKVDFGAIDKRGMPNQTIMYVASFACIMFIMLNISRLQSFRMGQTNTGAGTIRGAKGGRGALPAPSTTFNDVAGVDEAKEELAEIVDILKHPEQYSRLGARPPCGVLLVGSPGTGKTLLARAVAGEAGVPFISVSASEFVELYVGMGASRVRDVFARARAQAPSIVFIDEIDAVAKGRGDGKLRGMGNDEREQTLNQLLTELDGFDTGSLVICLAATNRPDTLDAALRRPGRFDRIVSVERPDRQGRREILGVHVNARKLPLEPGLELDDIAGMTAGFTGAELANLVNEAALLAGRAGLESVTLEQFEAAVLRSVAGVEKKRSLLGKLEKTVVSAHEAGHAIVGTAVGALIPGQPRPEQLSIISRSGGALGFTYIPPGEEDRKLMFADELRGRLVTLMGGRAAEMVYCGRVSTGAYDDIQRATDLAYKACAEFGLSTNIGPLSVPTLAAGGSEDALFMASSQGDAGRKVEREVRESLLSALYVAKRILEENDVVLDDISKNLEEEERVFGAALQTWLDKVEAPELLERFLQGENVMPAPGDEKGLFEALPLPPRGSDGVAKEGVDPAAKAR